MKKYLLMMLSVAAVAMFMPSCGGGDDSIPAPSPGGGGGGGGGGGDDPDGQKINMWAIDMTHLEHSGKHYAIWSGWDKYYVAREGTGQFLYIAEMTLNDTKPYVVLGQRVLLSKPTAGSWEIISGHPFSLLEGPQILKEGGRTFLIYSAQGSWGVNYQLGQMELTGADPLKATSWIKKTTPVFLGLQRAGNGTEGSGQYGVGHGSMLKSPDDSEWWISYASKTISGGGWEDRRVFFEKFTFSGGEPKFGDANKKPASSANAMTRPSGEVYYEKTLSATNPSPNASPSATFMNPVREGADPWIMKDDDNLYYTARAWGGIKVASSPYMTRFVTRSKSGDQYVYANTAITWDQAASQVWDVKAGKWNQKSPWAPELHHIGSKWYIFYAAGKQTAAPYWEHRAGVLISTTGPLGPYFEHDDEPLFTGEIGKASDWTSN